MIQKETYKILFIALAISLIVLPFVTTFNSVLTMLINKIGFYRWIQEKIVPIESRLVLAIARPLGIEGYLAPVKDRFAFYIVKARGGEKGLLPVDLQWNCLGWQSLLLLSISFLVGLQGGRFTRLSIGECVLIGILGTFFINILRIVIILFGIYFYNPIFALVVHDYFAALTTILWLFFFWWFSYKYVLEPREVI